jgi:hypothetical protein
VETAIPTEAGWRRAPRAEAHASCRASAPCYRFAKDVGFLPVIMAEGKFIQVKRQVFLRDMVKSSDHTAFQQGPKAVDILRVNLTPHVPRTYSPVLCLTLSCGYLSPSR